MKKTNWPKYVSHSNGRIVYRPRIAPEHRHIIDTDKHGFLRPPIRLGKPGDPETLILAAYLAAKNQIDAQINTRRNTVAWLIEQYMASRKFTSLAPKTQRSARSILGVLDHPMSVAGQPTTLGQIGIHQLTKPIIRRIADRRLEQYQQQGKKGTAIVNRQITLLSTAWRWAEQHLDGIPPDNPFRIEKFREQPRKRYITDDEYRIQHQVAAEISDYLPILLELTYLTATRGIEAIHIKISDCDPSPDGGIHIHRRKGSESNTIEWSERLLRAYHDARELHKRHKIADINAPLIIGAHGQQLRPGTVQLAMQRLKREMTARGLENTYWTLHMLKAKAVSDAPSDHIAGHKTEAMRRRYNTKLKRQKPAR